MELTVYLATTRMCHGESTGSTSIIPMSTNWRPTHTSWATWPQRHTSTQPLPQLSVYLSNCSGYLVPRGHYYGVFPSGVHVLTQNGHQWDTERSVWPLSSRVLVPGALSAAQDRQSLEEGVRSGKKPNPIIVLTLKWMTPIMNTIYVQTSCDEGNVVTLLSWRDSFQSVSGNKFITYSYMTRCIPPITKRLKSYSLKDKT